MTTPTTLHPPRRTGTANARPDAPFPVRGTPGGWRNPWDDPDDAAELRAQARLAVAAAAMRSCQRYLADQSVKLRCADEEDL